MEPKRKENRIKNNNGGFNDKNQNCKFINIEKRKQLYIKYIHFTRIIKFSNN